jgi:hypothetical protein
MDCASIDVTLFLRPRKDLRERVASTTFAKAVEMSDDLDTSQIENWRSVITLIIFALTSE